MALGKSSFWVPRWYWIPARVVVVTLVLGLLSLAVSLFVGIVATMISAWLGGAHPNLTTAYRFAAPVSGGMAGVALVVMTWLELRRYRQAKALAEIERTA